MSIRKGAKMKFHDFIEKTKSIASTFIKWIKKSRKNIVIAVCVALGIITGLVLFIHFVLPTLVAIAFVVFLFWDGRSGNVQPIVQHGSNLENPEIAWKVTNLAYDTITQNPSVFNDFCEMPSNIREIFDRDNYLTTIHGATTLRVYLLRRRNKDISQRDVDFVKNAYQLKIDAKSLDGYLTGHGEDMQEGGG